jgi:hypothetical protein
METPEVTPEITTVPTALPSLTTSSSLPKLGKLTQTARMKRIKSARTVLLFIGTISLLYGLAMTVFAETFVDSQIDKEIRGLGPNVIIDQAKLKEIKVEAYGRQRVGGFATIAEALAFLLLGVFVQKAPVPLTATGLILYAADWAVGSIFDPTYLLHGLIVKVLIMACLVKALNAAIAYERERRMELGAAV